MFKKFNLGHIFILSYLVLVGPSFASINIIASVDEEIITNYDVTKELRYLKVLSPNLNSLKKEQLSKLAKQSLIKEIIKKKEISKLISLDENNSFVDEYLQNLLTKLGYKNKKNFSDNLLKKKTYTLEEVIFKIKIELFWNELIFNKYNNQVIIDEKNLIKKLDNMKNDKIKEFLLSEIVFKRKKNEKLKDTISIIKKSINEIGFDNTANIYSISESSKYGGKIGWIKEGTLSKKIYRNIANLKMNEYSDVIKINNNFIILKINEIKIIDKKFDKKKEIQKLIQIEKNRKLEKFSRIYFNKVKTQYLINEK
ncbi:peptidylprolyl isomerase [Pelagibacterales bacterium SAG-MED09]|nr:peptidylprolyl isomerase [Pelagibacterales bacterium SAG-MED09]